jgi:hypothetical protein
MGATQMRLWKVEERIVKGVKRVGVPEGSMALPVGGFWMGVKYGTEGAGVGRGADMIFVRARICRTFLIYGRMR